MIRIVRDPNGNIVQGELVPVGQPYPFTPMYNLKGEWIDDVCIPQIYHDHKFIKIVQIESKEGTPLDVMEFELRKE